MQTVTVGVTVGVTVAVTVDKTVMFSIISQECQILHVHLYCLYFMFCYLSCSINALIDYRKDNVNHIIISVFCSQNLTMNTKTLLENNSTIFLI